MPPPAGKNAAGNESLPPEDRFVDAARPLTTHAPLHQRWAALGVVGLKMMFHDKLKLVGTLAGVVFAVVLSNQQGGTFLGLLHKNTMFIRNSKADVWITPPSAQIVQPGKTISSQYVYDAQVFPGVEWAEPLLFGGGTIRLPDGGTEAIQIAGTRPPRFAGGPWNIVAGSEQALLQTDTMIFENSERATLGGLNLGSVREVNNRLINVGGFTFGLIPFGPSYAFAEYDLARLLIGVDRDQVNYVLVGAKPGVDPVQLAADLQARFPDVQVLTTQAFAQKTVDWVLMKTPIGITLGSTTVLALIVGFVIVSLAMFSSVIDNLREFAVLKALGATTVDLALLLVVQSVTFAGLGSLIGLAAVSRVAGAIRSAKLAVILPPQLYIGTVILMTFICVTASSLAILRLRKLEPAEVFK